MSTERLIFSSIIGREGYARKVIPFLKKEYFHDKDDQVLYDLITDYVGKYNKLPTRETLAIDLTNKTNIDEHVFSRLVDAIEGLVHDPVSDEAWLIDQTETFCKDKALYNAIMESIQVMDGNKADTDKGAIPGILTDALSVGFDVNVGHDFFEDAEKRWDRFAAPESKIPFDIEILNKITKGGVSHATLNCVMAPSGVGKSLVLCHFAAQNMMIGKNVLYISLEMSEDWISRRIEANLMDTTFEELESMPKDKYLARIAKVRNKTVGGLVVQQYPTAAASVSHFRNLLRELKLKKKFVPDVIYIDYLNICASARMKFNSSVSSYIYVKSIAEEIRALAIELNIPIWTATQTNRSGYNNSDIDFNDTSESIGLPMTLDLFLAIISTEELDKLGQIMFKQLKNRYNDLNYYKRFVVGIDRSRMKIYDVEDSAQKDILDDSPVMDKTSFGRKDEERSKPPSKFGGRPSFGGFS